LDKRLQVTPDDASAHFALFENYEKKGMYKESIEQLQVAASLYGFSDVGEALAHNYATSGYRAAMRGFARNLGQLHMMPGRIAQFYTRAGDNDKAFKWLQIACNKHDNLTLLNVDPNWDPLRSDLRFKDLLHQVGLPQ
jgi:tetratricopeptide (TPR) repeat protein